jgi:hypothetical protein
MGKTTKLSGYPRGIFPITLTLNSVSNLAKYEIIVPNTT